MECQSGLGMANQKPKTGTFGSDQRKNKRFADSLCFWAGGNRLCVGRMRAPFVDPRFLPLATPRA